MLGLLILRKLILFFLCRCYSYIGRVFSGGQIVSIGIGCAQIPIVEHELLHALGFHHEQARYDRDDHVSIIRENIKKGSQTCCTAVLH